MASLKNKLAVACLSGALAFSPLAQKLFSQSSPALNLPSSDKKSLLEYHEVATRNGVRMIFPRDSSEDPVLNTTSGNVRQVAMNYIHPSGLKSYVHVTGIGDTLRYYGLSTIKGDSGSVVEYHNGRNDRTNSGKPYVLRYALKLNGDVFHENYETTRLDTSKAVMDSLVNEGNRILRESH